MLKSRFVQISNSSYVIVNIAFASIIIVIFTYSTIFSEAGISHPIPSLTTNTTVSTGLSRAFSEIIRFNFEKAVEFNRYSILIFLFFFTQLIIRIAYLLLLINRVVAEKHLLIIDIIATVLLFLLSFSRFILDQF